MIRFKSASCEGERCFCGAPADEKVEQAICSDDPQRQRHAFTAYICDEHFVQIMGPRAQKPAPTSRECQP